MYNIAIIGGGVAGLYLANLIENKNILLLEEHQDLGPRRCSGIVSKRIFDLIELPKYCIEKEVESMVLNCGNTTIEIKVNSVVLNKEYFEKYLLKKAKKKVDLKFERAVEIINGSEGVRIRTENNEYKSKYIVGCDGPNSIVRRVFIGESPKKFYFGRFGYAREKPSDYHEIFLDSKYSDLFAWKSPKRSKVEYGVLSEKNLKRNYSNFLKEKRPEIIEEGFGVIPINFFKYSFSKGILIGNAAAQTKPLTGGGIIYSMCAAQIASQELKKKNPDFLRYEKRCKKIFEKEIKRQLLFRKIYSKLSDKRKEKLLRSFADEKFKFDMDFPMKSIFRDKKIKLFRSILGAFP